MLSRRTFLGGLGAGTAAVATGACSFGNESSPTASSVAPSSVASSSVAPSSPDPDIYVVTLDDCSPEYIGFYQGLLPTAYPGEIHTPEIDSILAESWVASSARATSASCPASRSAFLTASASEQTGLFGADGLLGATVKLERFHAKVSNGTLVSLPGLLTDMGFDTATRGKVDHDGGMMKLPGQVVDLGVHTEITALLRDPAFTPGGLQGQDGSAMPLGVLPPDVTHPDRQRLEEQISRIESPYTDRRVDFLGFYLPHTPRTVHQEWLDLYDAEAIQLRTTPEEITADRADLPARAIELLDIPVYPNGVPRAEWMYENLTEAQLKLHVHHMLATVSHTSFLIGRLKSALDSAGRPYILILTSDHGYHLAEKGHYAKGTLYDKALLVPLGIYSSEPRADYPVGVADHPISLLGLCRTVAELAGVDASLVPSQWGGRAFHDDSGGFTDHHFGDDAASMSTARVFKDESGRTFKRIVHPGDSGELYDLTADPGEIDNLVAPGESAEPAGDA